MTEATQAPAAEGTSTTITLVDLQNVVKIIDAAAERGAFKGGELTAVGTVRDKVAAFLAATLPAPEEAAAPADADPAAEAPKAKAAPKKARAAKK